MTDDQSSPPEVPEAKAPEGGHRGNGVSRRKVIAGAGVGVAAVAATGFAVGRTTAPDDGPSGDQVVPFRGQHQAGIITAAQDRLHFASFDVITDKRDELVAMLKEWTAAAERLTHGDETTPGGAVGLGDYTPPSDTGEALGLTSAHLTLTIGFGPSLFGPTSVNPKQRDRFGLAARKPTGFDELPMFAAEKIETSRSYGDICVQACADDPQVAVHAIRNLARIGMGVVAVRWSQLGFGRTASTSTSQATPRNLFGFKDGTNNLHAEEPELLDKWVWVDKADNPSAAQWMTGGTYLVARRIRMDIEPWDRANLLEQEQIVGRLKGNGAPLGQHKEFDEPDFDITSYGVPLIPKDAHVRLAHEKHIGVRLLRRGYNFTDGSDGFGHLDAGLFFIAFNRNTAKQFVPMQQELSRKDAMTEYLIPNASATFAIPPGLGKDEYWGQRLFEG
ncbi:iron uptake transporter deferrochelatase/peroxidase subunit [Gordonia sp. (in: high G+C Gram-positive bacteria)]|jgi:deferrochelatase/peroxidase EfeB|uniref:iron uptake transporter deferrochelatase/peroxidase subunit n=1 Tax=Gordonia sp. (in: high G+C Gram-positive bacteria) TaxID=84139 RepID=UPI00261F410D|nr:iron uptake transporter deferrochelatase/peroxidase subunit [Gordonia sp. (in: high G+C Gram-positive bacteria)]HMS76533.1 iron uptake transporter deferrochelatase/peroxidase subunit [Gordonia sp. (in: high G+C Gram-positive bacteria)]